MSTVAYAPKQPRGAHARIDTPPEIRVIPGGLLTSEPAPRPRATRLRGTLRGMSYGFTSRERALALGAGIVFALVSLLAVLI